MAKSPKGANGFVSDGHPSDSIHYREYKLILRPERCTSRDALHAFSKLVRGAAKEEGVDVRGVAKATSASCGRSSSTTRRASICTSRRSSSGSAPSTATGGRSGIRS